MSSLALIQDQLFLSHQTGFQHPESSQRLQAISKMLEESGLAQKLPFLEPRAAEQSDLERVHTASMIDRVRQTSAFNQIFLDPDTVTSQKSWEAASLAAGSGLTGIDHLLEGKTETVFAFPRPPGHHAESDRSMGFCLFNNVAIAAEYAIQKKGLKKIFILDFDVHHGNGTQEIFEERSDVFYLSVHQSPFYPGTGLEDEIGRGKGEGYTLNFPLSEGGTDEIYFSLFKERVVPVLSDYQSDLLIVSAGFDAHRFDPLGGMNLTDEGFRGITFQIEKIRKQLNLPALYMLEGGYHLQALASSVQNVIETILER